MGNEAMSEPTNPCCQYCGGAIRIEMVKLRSGANQPWWECLTTTCEGYGMRAGRPAPYVATGAIERALITEYDGRYTCTICRWTASGDRENIFHDPAHECTAKAALTEARELRAEVERLIEMLQRYAAAELSMSARAVQAETERNEVVGLLREAKQFHTNQSWVYSGNEAWWHERTVFLAGIDGEEGGGDG